MALTMAAKRELFLQSAGNAAVDMVARSRGARAMPEISLSEFSKTLYPRYQESHFLKVLDYVLTKVALYSESGGQEGIGRLIIEAPPRHGKTLKVSRLFPCWYLARNPNHRMMLVSYGDSLSRKNGRAVRNFTNSVPFRDLTSDVRLAKDSKAANSWNIQDFEGGLEALGIGGAATGVGANGLIIDDAVKNRAEAESPTMRKKTYDAFKDDLSTRLEPAAFIIIMMQRWHEDDLTGAVLRDMADEGWYRLRFPAICPDVGADNEIAGDYPEWRQPGEALWPKRFPIGALIKIKNRLGAYAWSGQYDQNPTPSEGGIYKRKWFKPRLRRAPQLRRIVRYWDLAMSEKTTADFTAGVKLGIGTDEHRYVLDVARAQVELDQLPSYLKDVILSDGKSVVQGFEMKGYMTRAIKLLAKDPDLYGFTLMGCDVESDKFTRALPSAAKMSLGMIHIIDGTYAKDFEDECCSFPNGTNDDQVDGFSGANGMIDDYKSERTVAVSEYGMTGRKKR